ncbi:MAG: hypothetical protein AAB486_04235 [Patescibacteria group bacterium]
MPATTTTFPTSSPVPLPKKKPGGGGPPHSPKGFFEKFTSKLPKNILKQTRIKGVITTYEKVEDFPGELKKAVKLAAKDRVFYSAFGPYFRQNPIYGVMELTANAPKKVFNLVNDYVWQPNTTWGYEKHVTPTFANDQKDILNHFAQNQFQETDQLGHLVLNNDKGERLKLAYDRRIEIMGVKVPFSQGKGAIKNTTVWTPKANAGNLRALGTVFQVIKKGALGYGLSFINPLLAPLPILLDDKILSHLGWETQGGIYRDKIGLPLINGQNEHVSGLKVLTEDGREWLLPQWKMSPADIRAKARVFKGGGRLAGFLNRVAGLSRGAYLFNRYIFDHRALENFGWIREIGEVNLRGGQTTVNVVHRSGRLSQLGRSLTYLHPKNWINGEAFKKLGFAESLILGADGKPMRWLTKLTPRQGFEWAQYLYSVSRLFSRNPSELGRYGWENIHIKDIKDQMDVLLRNGGRFAQFNRLLFYLHPKNWLLGNETWKRLGWDTVGGAFEKHPIALADKWGPKKLTGVNLIPRNSTNRLTNFVHRSARLIHDLHPKTWLGKAGGAVKGWLLAAKKKSDGVWKKLISIPLKFLFDLAMKALSKLASVIWSKVGPLLSRLSGFISSHIPAGVKSIFSKVGAGIGESVVGKLFAKIGAQLAGRALLGVAARFIGNVLLKGAFEAFAWATAPEIQVLSYAWRGIQWLLGQTVGRVLGALSSKMAVSLASRLGVPVAQMGIRFLLGTVLRGIGTFLATSAWPAVAGFFTSTLPAWVAGAGGALSTALAGISFASLALTIGIATTLAGLIFIITIYVPALFWNPARSEVTHTQVVLDKIAKVVPGDPATSFIGTNRLPVDNLEHTVEYFFRVRNTADKKATAIKVTDAKLVKTFPLDGSTIDLNPGQELEIGRFAVKIRANSERVETNEAIGTAVIEGETITFSDVGLLLIGNPAWAPPCGWPATGTLRVLFLDKYPLCPSESECSGIQIVGLPDEFTFMRQSQKIRSTLNGVVSQLWFDLKLGGVMKIKGLDGSFEIVYAYLTEASVRPVSGGLTKYGLEVGTRVNLNQEVAETYFGPLPLSWDTSLHYQVKVLHYGSGVSGFDNKDPLEFTPTRPDRDATVQAGGC